MTAGLSSWLGRISIGLARSGIVVVVDRSVACRGLRVSTRIWSCTRRRGTVPRISCHSCAHASPYTHLLVGPVGHNVATVVDILLRISLRERLSLFVLLEGGKTHFLPLLPGLPVGFSFDSVQPHLICISFVDI